MSRIKELVISSGGIGTTMWISPNSCMIIYDHNKLHRGLWSTRTGHQLDYISRGQTGIEVFVIGFAEIEKVFGKTALSGSLDNSISAKNFIYKYMLLRPPFSVAYAPIFTAMYAP